MNPPLTLVLLLAVLLTGCGDGGPASGPPAGPVARQAAARRVVFLGDSLTAGHNLDRSQAFPALIQEKVRQAGLPFEIVNAGVSGDTSAGGLQRLDWVLTGGAELVVLELGANDGLRGLDLDATRANLRKLVQECERRKIPVVLAGMRLPPNYGPDYTARFQEMYAALASQHSLPLIPFLLEGVGGVQAVNLPDGIHPNAEGQKRVADTVWKTLEPLLRKLPR
jgi:acyl-CoA thioesterase-1